MEKVEIPDCVISIGEYAFANCDYLSNVNIPDSVTSIGESAFYNCSSLTNITIPNGVTEIGRNAFYNCSSLMNLAIPDSVNSIGEQAFAGTPWFEAQKENRDYLVLGDGVLCWVSYVTGTFNIPDEVKSIGGGVFEGFYLLTGIVIPNSVTRIGGFAFNKCINLNSIEIPGSVHSIGVGAFNDTPWFEAQKENRDYLVLGDGVLCWVSPDVVETFIVPGGVTSLGGGVFEDCDSLTSFIIPDGVTTIGAYAFFSCNNLTSLVIPDSVTEIGEMAFDFSWMLEVIYTPKGSFAEKWLTENWVSRNSTVKDISEIATPTPEPTKAPTPEPTKEPEKSADNNGCSDEITAVSCTGEDIKDVVETIRACANIAADGTDNAYCTEYAKEEFENVFGPRKTGIAECKATVTKYETYIHGDGSFTVYLTLETCGKEFTVYATKSNGEVEMSSLTEIYEIQRDLADAIIGDDAGITYEDTLVPDEPEPDITDGMNEEEKWLYEQGGWTSHRGDGDEN